MIERFERIVDDIDCTDLGSGWSCDFYLQDEWQNAENHEISSVASWDHEDSPKYRIHWVDGPEARKVAREDGWSRVCNHRPKMWSVSHHGDGDRLRHITCDDVRIPMVPDVVNNTMERFQQWDDSHRERSKFD